MTRRAGGFNAVLGIALAAVLWLAPAPVAADHHEAENPCNPCGGKAENPCNPCGGEAENPCNPCGGKAENPCNPCGGK